MQINLWCKKCGGRVFLDEIWWDQEKHKMQDYLCLLCSQRKSIPWEEHLHLMKSIEHAIVKKKSQNSTRKILS